MPAAPELKARAAAAVEAAAARDPRALRPDPREPGAGVRGGQGGRLVRRGDRARTATRWSTRPAAWRPRSGAG